MTQDVKAVVGDWYQDASGRVFEVVAIDDDEAVVGIQYFEGDIAELDDDTWDLLELSPAAPPEDWSGAYDEMEPDDLGYFDIAKPVASNPLATLEPEAETE